ncbi:Cysteine-rich membrane protein 2 [Spironucleus salmonicida]|uniref:Cysteine-rich membrane protein 2 n=1 Tax=Spironucleus salmonicida TaxID=348837 RepID=V6LVZ5_9EUKA|nr:Cysteine-rich membrane protein 2 [Spironucleus salmonicida]|eukprot:EST48802.1 Cysteine-rich membrane protein 2 [Spironucleus salmonicida]
MTECRVNSHCKEGQYCDTGKKMCTPCQDGCTVCASATFCVSCPVGKILNTNGTCTNQCDSALEKGFHCKDGAATACQLNITTPCNCGGGLNCETCDNLSNDCGTCLKGYIKDTDQKCLICDANYTQIGSLCTLSTNLPDLNQDPNDPFVPGQKDEANSIISGGEITGIVIGSLLFLLLLILLIIYIIWRNRKQNQDEEGIIEECNGDPILLETK